MKDRYTYRPRTGWVYLAIILLMGLSAIIGFAISARYDAVIMSLVNILAVCLIYWVFVIYPKVVYTKEGIEIHNPFFTFDIGWLTSLDFNTRYSFTVLTASRKIAAWGAPAPSRFNTRKIHNSDFRGTGLESRVVVSPSDSPRAESGVAQILALKYKERAISEGTAVEKLSRKFNMLSLAAVTLSIVLLSANFLV
ncbi:MAG: hypothetical protein ACKOFA_01200 [Rhodoluna sp.]